MTQWGYNMQDGFYFDELSDFRKDLLREVNNIFPEETDKFLKDEARNLSKLQKKIAIQRVGTSKGKKKDWLEAKSYLKKFKVGKIYYYLDDEKSVRAFNSARHAHLIENGHFQVPRGKKGQSNEGGTPNGWTEGKYVLKTAQNQYKEYFYKNTENFLYKYFDDIGN